MNPVEPLSWPAPLHGDGLVAHEREGLMSQHFAALMSLSVRSTFRAVATYLEGCRRSLPAVSLAASVHAALGLGRMTFELAAEGPLIGGSLRTDCARCLARLERLATSLSHGESWPHGELAHEMDTLIALLVQLEGSGPAPSTAWAGRSLPAHSTDSRSAPIPRRGRVPQGATARLMANGQ